MQRCVILCALRNLLALCIVAAAFLCVSGTTSFAATAKYNWKFANPLTQPHVDVYLEKFCKKVTEYSNGQIAIKYFPNGQLGTHDEGFHSVQEGSIQIATVHPYVNLVPGGMISWLPWTISNYKEFKLAFALENGPKGPFANLMEVAFAEVGLKPLFHRSQGGLGLGNRIRELKTPEDFKGLKFRVSASLGFVRALENMCKGSGATFETLPRAEVYNALSKGVVDAIWDAWIQLLNERNGEVLKYYTDLNWGWDYAAIAINKEQWDSLPDELKKAVEKAAEETQNELAAFEEKTEIETIEKVAKQYPHLKITTLTEEQRDTFRQKANMPAVWDELCKPWLDKAFPGQNMTAKMLSALDDIRNKANK